MQKQTLNETNMRKKQQKRENTQLQASDVGEAYLECSFCALHLFKNKRFISDNKTHVVERRI